MEHIVDQVSPGKRDRSIVRVKEVTANFILAGTNIEFSPGSCIIDQPGMVFFGMQERDQML